MVLPMRDDLLELTRLPELPACGRVLRALGVLVLIELPMREDLLELTRLPELLDGMRVLLLLGTRTFTLLVVLLEPVLRGELLREEILLRVELLREEILLRVELLRGELLREEMLLRVELLRGELLREEILLRLVEDLGVVVLVGALLTDRDEVVVLVGALLTDRDEVVVLVGALLTDRDEVVVLEELDLLGVDRRLLEDEEGLEVCRLLELLLLDLLLLLDAFSAKTGSIVSIRAKNNIPTTIVTFLGFFSLAIILLLKYLM
jgi:hypothetical protein